MKRAFTIGGKKGEGSSAPRIIPGPAGKYQQAMARRERGKDIGDPVSTQEFVRAAMEEEEVDTDFNTPHWNNAIDAALMEGMSGDTEIVAMKRFNESTRVQTVIAMIKECTPNGLGDAQLELKDKTGTIRASIHRKAFKEASYSKHIVVGSILILKEVVAFCIRPKLPIGNDMGPILNITERNIVLVLPKPTEDEEVVCLNDIEFDPF